MQIVDSVLLRVARKEWRKAGGQGTHSEHQAGVIAGTVRAYAAVTGLTETQATERVRNAARSAMPPQDPTAEEASFKQPFLAWIVRNWDAGATFSADELNELQGQWKEEGGELPHDATERQ